MIFHRCLRDEERASPQHQSPCHSTTGTNTKRVPKTGSRNKEPVVPSAPLLERLSPVPDAPGLQLWEGREPRGGGHCGNRAVRVKTYFKLCSVVVFLLKTQAVK